MKTTIKTESGIPGSSAELVVEVESAARCFHSEPNILFTKTECGTDQEITFHLDAKAAKALSFALGELAKELGRNK